MTQNLLIGGHPIPVKLLPAARALSLKWTREGTLEIYCPGGKMDVRTEQFLHSKSAWINKHYHRFSKFRKQQEAFWQMVGTDHVLINGKATPIFWQSARSRQVGIDDRGLFLSLTSKDREEKARYVLPALRAVAAQQLTRSCLAWSQRTGDPVANIRVRDQSSKWGSCSGKRNINLNWRLLFLPANLQDYVLVHELMHLRQLNHSPAFWGEVARYIPHWQHERTLVHEWEWVFGLDEPLL
jgi:predicted metal-dependent hydrolase